jgi:hypothetical protein
VSGAADDRLSVDQVLFQTVGGLLRPDVYAIALLSVDDPQPARADGRRVLRLQHVSLSPRVWDGPLPEAPHVEIVEGDEVVPRVVNALAHLRTPRFAVEAPLALPGEDTRPVGWIVALGDAEEPDFDRPT